MIKTIQKIAISLFTCLIISVIFLNVQYSYSQVIKDFVPRKSAKAPVPYTNVKNYNLQGDFTMIGNTNLTLKNYTNEETNAKEMIFVDIDNVDNTFNSSSSELVLPGGECTEIVYAGLYWSGRAHDIDDRSVNSSPTTFNVTSNVWKEGTNISTTETIKGSANVNIPNSSYTISKSREGSRNNYYTRFVISSERTGLSYIINFENGVMKIWDPLSNDWKSPDYSESGGNIKTTTLNKPFIIRDGGLELKIKSFTRESRLNQSSSSAYTNSNNSITIDFVGKKVSLVAETRTLDKRKVKLKAGDNPYIDIVANDSDIYFPTKTEGVMYSAYADVTDYVRQHGNANYFVADMALNPGIGGGTGFYGGWGMVIVYKNPTMKWKDITVFDGHGYMVKSVGSAILPVEGFRAAQHGDVKVKMGMMAGEGDVGIPGDYFHIANAANTKWVALKHGGNSDTNFFNSSIYTGGNSRNPNLVNNTGIDIAMFDLDNRNNSIIANNQTTTNFSYGTSQDTYIIYNIVFAVDAYVPEIIGENKATNFGGVKPLHNGTISPGQEFEFELDVYNKGTEAVKNTKIEIPVPFNLHYSGADIIGGLPAGGTISWIPPVGAPNGATSNNTAGGTIVWNIGNLPLDSNKEKVLAQLKYRFRVSNDCILLSTSGDCGLEVKINGKISGEGVNSKSLVKSDLVRDYGQGVCAGPVYDDFMSTISLTTDFLQSCNPPVENGIMQFKAFCNVPTDGFAREDIVAKYPAGTKFFSIEPASYDETNGLVSGNFPVNPNGSKKMYYVMTPGMGAGCYARLEISVDMVVTEPIAKNITVCFGEPIVLENELSQTGVTNQYSLVYFAADQITQLSSEPNPEMVGVHTYFVAEGKDGCVGPKKSFTITINALPEITGSVENMEICTNFNAEKEITTTATTGISWEYATTGSTTWESLTSATFTNKVVIAANKIEVKHADSQINGIKVRMKVSNGQCTATSGEFVIQVKDCPGVTNPMLMNPAIQ